MASVVGFVGRGGKIMLCVRVAEIAARFALCVTARIELVACILRTFVKSSGNAGASGVGAFCVAVTLKIYLLDFSTQVCSCPPDTAAIVTGISQVCPSAAVAVIYIVPPSIAFLAII